MRITLIHYSFPPVLGGVEIVMAEHARLFAAAGHAVTVCCARGESSSPDIELIRWPEEAAEREAVLRRVLAEQDIVFLHNVCTMPFDLGLTELLWRLADELPKVRFVSWIHDLAACNPDYDLPALNKEPWSLLAGAHHRMEHVVISEHRRSQFAALTAATSRVIPNGIDPLKMLGLPGPVEELARCERILERDVVLIHPARLLRRKNVEFGIRTLADLKRTDVRAALLVTGLADPHQASANYAAELRRLRDQLGVEKEVIFVGDRLKVGRRELVGLLSISDALFFPSRQEGFGLPILEAALHRLPIFCTDLPPMNSVLGNNVHAFAPDATSEEVALMILHTLNRSAAHRARKEMVRRYGWEAIYREFLEPLVEG